MPVLKSKFSDVNIPTNVSVSDLILGKAQYHADKPALVKKCFFVEIHSNVTTCLCLSSFVGECEKTSENSNKRLRNRSRISGGVEAHTRSTAGTKSVDESVTISVCVEAIRLVTFICRFNVNWVMNV